MSAPGYAADAAAQPQYASNDYGNGDETDATYNPGEPGPSQHNNGITIANNLPHPPPTPTKKQSGSLATPKTKRSRWATRKMTVKSSNKKRLSLMGRANGKAMALEKKRASSGSESYPQSGDAELGDNAAHAEEEEEEEEYDGPGPRTLYFNLPLPEDQKDETGAPKQSYARNKIRTAKYTPLSFIPKNLYFQFQNIANIFFLFLVILAVRLHPSLSLSLPFPLLFFLLLLFLLPPQQNRCADKLRH